MECGVCAAHRIDERGGWKRTHWANDLASQSIASGTRSNATSRRKRGQEEQQLRALNNFFFSRSADRTIVKEQHTQANKNNSGAIQAPPHHCSTGVEAALWVPMK